MNEVTPKMMTMLSAPQRQLVARALAQPLPGALCQGGDVRTARTLAKRGFGTFDESTKRFAAHDATRIAWSQTFDNESQLTSAKGVE